MKFILNGFRIRYCSYTMCLVKYFFFLSTVCFNGLDFKNPHLKAPGVYIAEEMARKSAERTAETPASALRTTNSRTKTKWFEQPLNHFDPADNRKFKMKYFVDDSFWVPNGPIFLYINGEVDAMDILSSLLLYEIAEDTNGLVIATEHRYFGESKPNLNFSVTKNLKYLHSRQALADLARLIEAIKASPTAACSKVVVAGSSYAASLAAWMRVIYPNLVYAAVSSSGPLLSKKYFPGYMNIIGYSFGKYGLPGCYDAIRKIFQRYDKLLQTRDGIDELKREKNICKDEDLTIPKNKQYFFLVNIIEFVRAGQLGSIEQIRQNCSNFMRSSSVELQPSQFYKDNKGCKRFRYADYIENERNESLFWVYMLCTQMGYGFIASSESPFTENLPAEFCLDRCPHLFGADFNEKRIDEGVASINKMYGALHPPVTNVLFVGGEADPWAPLTVMKPLPYNPTVIVIPGATHCSDIYFTSQRDPPEVAIAKRKIIDIVKDWVRNDNLRDVNECLDKNRDDRLINLILEHNMIQDPISEALYD